MIPVAVRPLKKTPSVKFLLDPSKILVQFLVCFQTFTETKLFASSLLCCSIFTVVLLGTIQCVILYFYEVKFQTKYEKHF